MCDDQQECILEIFLCDGIANGVDRQADCSDGSDEAAWNCGHVMTTVTATVDRWSSRTTDSPDDGDDDNNTPDDGSGVDGTTDDDDDTADDGTAADDGRPPVNANCPGFTSASDCISNGCIQVWSKTFQKFSCRNAECPDFNLNEYDCSQCGLLWWWQ